MSRTPSSILYCSISCAWQWWHLSKLRQRMVVILVIYSISCLWTYNNNSINRIDNFDQLRCWSRHSTVSLTEGVQYVFTSIANTRYGRTKSNKYCSMSCGAILSCWYQIALWYLWILIDKNVTSRTLIIIFWHKSLEPKKVCGHRGEIFVNGIMVGVNNIHWFGYLALPRY